MAFRVKDLMISDVSGSEGPDPLGLLTGKNCCRPASGGILFSCWCWWWWCGPGAVAGQTPYLDRGDPAARREQLALLKAQLKEELAQIEKEEEALEARLKPQTVAEVESLQHKMREAVEELEKLKAELRDKKAEILLMRSRSYAHKPLSGSARGSPASQSGLRTRLV